MLADHKADSITPFPTKRPNFSRMQIINIEQLHKNSNIRIHCVDECEIKGSVVRSPFKEQENWYIEVELRKGHHRWTVKLALADYSVIRYSDCTWNPHNWLEKA